MQLDNGQHAGQAQSVAWTIRFCAIETGGHFLQGLRICARSLVLHGDLHPPCAIAALLLRRGRTRGELREGVSTALASDMLLSAMETHAGRIGPGETMREDAITAYAARVADLLIGCCQYGQVCRGTTRGRNAGRARRGA